MPVQLSVNPNLPAFAQYLTRTATFLRVGEHQKEAAEEFGQMLEQVEIGHRVEDADPTDDELSNIVIIVEHLLAVAMEGHAIAEVTLNKAKSQPAKIKNAQSVKRTEAAG